MGLIALWLCLSTSSSAQHDHEKAGAMLIPVEVSDDFDICIERTSEPTVWCFTVGDLRASYKPSKAASIGLWIQ